MTRIGVISDTHLTSFNDFPKPLLDKFKEVDLILHAGDLVSLAVLEGLQKIGPEVFAVSGNMDQTNVKDTLNDSVIIPINQFHIGLTHGFGAPFNLMKTVKEKFSNKELDCIVYGHSHTPQNKVSEGILYFNPGSPTDRFFAPYKSYGILQIDKEITGRIIKI